jgi:predicted phage terminase large subunit-like protein
LYVVEHVVNGKWPPGKRDMVIHSRTQMDGGDCHVYLEEEPGSGGIAQCEYLTKMLSGYRVTSEKASGNKFNRAAPFASQLQAGNVTLVVGEWNAAFIDQLHAADPTKSEKDQDLDMMDAAAKAFNVLASRSLNSYAVETGVEVAEDGEDRPLSGRDPDEDGKESFMGFSYDSDAWEGAWN